MSAQIIVQGYGPDGLFVRATFHQDTFTNFEQVKVKANSMWREFKAPDIPYLQLFIADTERQKNIFYHSNFPS